MIPNLVAIYDSVAPRYRCTVPCPGWTSVPDVDGLSAYKHESGLFVLASNDIMRDKSEWLHVSVSRTDRVPDWEDLKLVKESFIGRNEEAVVVLPKERDYVNLHPYCMHIWSPA